MSGKRKLFVQMDQRIGRGVVIDPDVTMRYPSSRYPQHAARLLCDCGNEYTTALCNLVGKYANTVSCGCKKREAAEDLTGMKFGMLTAIERAPNRQRNGPSRTFWLCECDCGGRKVVETHGMKSGSIKSCGCLRNPPKSGSAQRTVLRTYKGAARSRGLTWELSDEIFNRLTSGLCEYCDAPPSRISQSKAGEIFVWNGIDRVNNALGYIEGNVVTCCMQCNIGKRDYTLDEFKSWIGRLAIKNGFVRPEGLSVAS